MRLMPYQTPQSNGCLLSELTGGDEQYQDALTLSVTREDSAAKSAALFAAKDPQKALEKHEAAGKDSKLQALAKIPANIEAKLDANMKLMDELELSATPAIFYLDDKGGLQQQQGAEISGAWTDAFASKPAPTLDRVHSFLSVNTV